MFSLGKGPFHQRHWFDRAWKGNELPRRVCSSLVIWKLRQSWMCTWIQLAKKNPKNSWDLDVFLSYVFVNVIVGVQRFYNGYSVISRIIFVYRSLDVARNNIVSDINTRACHSPLIMICVNATNFSLCATPERCCPVGVGVNKLVQNFSAITIGFLLSGHRKWDTWQCLMVGITFWQFIVFILGKPPDSSGARRSGRAGKSKHKSHLLGQ